MNVITCLGQTYKGPATWDELTPRQWLQWVRWQMAFGGDPAGRFLLLRLWYRLPFKLLRRLDEEQQARLLDLLDWTTTRPETWKLPLIWHRGSRFMGPGDGLQYLTFGEYIFAEAAQQRYLATSNPTDLAELTAVLYAPKPWPWQRALDGGRPRFNRHVLEARAARFQTLSPAVQQAALINFLGCLETFPQKFPHLFKPAAEGGDGSGSWLDVGLNLARQTSALGTFHQLEETNLYLVLTTLDGLVKEQEAIKVKMDSSRD